MQRTESGGVIISCDFCGTDWDPYDESNPVPMIEGHLGSVICLVCVQRAMKEMSAADDPYRCSMCIIEGIEPETPRWFHPEPTPSPGLNPHAVICKKCIHHAAGRFSKDPDVDWKWVR
jgi:hypothetical protein